MEFEKVKSSEVSVGELKKTLYGISLPLNGLSFMLRNVSFKISEAYLDPETAEPTFSLRISLEDEVLEKMKKIEKKVISMAMNEKENLKAFLEKVGKEIGLGEKVLVFNEESFKIVRNENEVWGKLYHTKVGQDFKISTRFWELIEKAGVNKKKPVKDAMKILGWELEGDVAFSIKQVFFGKRKGITCVAKEVLLKKMTKPVSAFDEFSDDESD